MSFAKRFAARLRAMSRPAGLILKIALLFSCVYLAAALVVLLLAGDFTARACEAHLLARYLYTTPQAILLVAVIASAIVEEAAVKGAR